MVRVSDLMEAINSMVSEPCIKGLEEELKNGLVYGDSDARVTGIVVAWKATSRVLRYAKEKGANTIVFHEDVFYRWDHHPIVVNPRSSEFSHVNLRIASLMDGLNLFRYHTTWDDAPGGNNDSLVEALGLKLEKRLPCSRLASPPEPMSLHEFVGSVKRVLGVSRVIVAGAPVSRVERVMVVAGGGAKSLSILDSAVAHGANVLLSADTIADTAFYAMEAGLAIVDPGHHPMEEYGMEVFARKLREKLGSSVDVYFYRHEPAIRIL